MSDLDDADEPDIPLASGTTAAAARSAGHPTRVVPASIPDDFHAHVSVAVKERVKLGPDGINTVVIEQSYTVEWISPDTWVRLVAHVLAAAG